MKALILSILFPIFLNDCFGQSTITVIGIEEDARIDNIDISVRELQSGRPTITGLPIYSNGIQFADGTIQTTAATGQLASSQTWTGTNIYTQTIYASSGIVVGDRTQDFVPFVAMPMKSIDGATQSSGCLVAVGMSGANPTDRPVFTSTTTSAVGADLGVLLDNSCTVGSVCLVGTTGFFRIANNGGTTAGNFVQLTTTRCAGAANSAAGPGQSGKWQNTLATGLPGWIHLW